jgi:uncharacterized coiled-coil DUF342 family protein|tara:strand:+ start:149 stop:379 length:231 start_codon:yes stop_codon:yes gene_type:complete
MKPKKKTTKVIANRNGIRISYHEKICAERMKTLFKAIDEMRKDIKELKGFMNRGKGAATIMMILGGLIGSFFYFLK